jgi:hypothetical protein
MSFVGVLVIMPTSCVFPCGSASSKMDLFHIAKQAGENQLARTRNKKGCAKKASVGYDRVLGN